MFLTLLFLHHLADVAFQPSWLIKNKKLHAFAIYEHAFIWTGVVSIGLAYYGIIEVWKILFLFIGHFLIDYFKYKKEGYEWTYLDQALHYLQIIAVL